MLLAVVSFAALYAYTISDVSLDITDILYFKKKAPKERKKAEK